MDITGVTAFNLLGKLERMFAVTNNDLSTIRAYENFVATNSSVLNSAMSAPGQLLLVVTFFFVSEQKCNNF